MTVSRYDSIVIGAGHNGLVCASYLAKAGHSVLVLESSDAVGGLAAQREFGEGYSVAVAHGVNHFPAAIAKDLNLASHGYHPLSQPGNITGLSSDGQHRIASGNTLSGVSDQDNASYRDYLRLMQRFAKTLEPFWFKTMPRIGNNALSEMTTFAQLGLKIRSLGKKDMQEFLRIIALPTRDLMDEFFEDDILKAALNWDGLIGSKLAPRSPNSSVFAMLYRMSGEAGGAGLVEALREAAISNGVEIRTGAAVSRVHTEASSAGLTVNGVHLADGEKIEAANIVSSADPKTTFLDLVGVENLEIGFTNRIRRLRCDGYVGKLHLALSELPEFTGLDQPDGRLLTAPNLDAIEFAYDDAKYGDCSEHPVMEITIPSIHDSSLAPPGKHVLSAHVMYVPYKLKGGWTDTAREVIRERAIDTIENFAPGIRDCIEHREFLSPQDLETHFNVTGGHWHHTEMALDQMLMMRPTYEAAQYATPLPGLYLCGAGCHPGGDLTGASGHNAAREILR